MVSIYADATCIFKTAKERNGALIFIPLYCRTNIGKCDSTFISFLSHFYLISHFISFFISFYLKFYLKFYLIMKLKEALM